MYDAFYPGQLWLDTEGKRIQAHGGSMFYEKGTYYWYGENKELTDGQNGIWHNGVRCYASQDLYNWKDLGIIIPPDTDPNSTLHPSSCMDRPHIVFNPHRHRYYCYLKIMENNGNQSMTVLTANCFLGPYTKVKEHFQPFGMNCGDFDLTVSEDAHIYWYFERVHQDLICAELTEDGLDVKSHYSVLFPHPEGVPYVREAPAHFTRKGKHYLLTSGTTGYYPNPSEVAVAESYHGPFTILGNPHMNDTTNTSFHSQISCVFQVHGKPNCYIAMADRWLPKSMHISYADTEQVFSLYSAGEYEKANKLIHSLRLPPENTSIADYVWLPIRFDNDRPTIEWYDRWTI